MKQGAILEGVEVPPTSLAVIMDGSAFEAIRADPELVRRESDPDVNFTFGQLQLHPLDPPRRRQAEQLGVESLVVHDRSSFGFVAEPKVAPGESSNEIRHTEAGRAPIS